ncbi:MAG: hypothetical protein HKN40_11225 [Winogradskyella sp.]|uniref:hypothetical protein n=1 Tax=Winogradskyella sp. TaxID=1883156 RepID=UPI00182C3CF0|nr:hypothetical protein [Winogradskyella sp.]
MIIKKIKRLIEEQRSSQKQNTRLLEELEWAHIYHDSIRGKPWLYELPLNIGRWAGNYAFFYVLNRILNDFKPKSILEFGLGESSKFVSKYLEYYLKDAQHTIIEQNNDWKKAFESTFNLTNRSKIVICPITTTNIKNFTVNVYEDLELKVNSNYDLFIVDGPYGSHRFSRYDIVVLAQKFETNKEFIILLDDYHRKGEKDTANELLLLFKSKNIKTYSKIYNGRKSLIVIATEKYKYIASL